MSWFYNGVEVTDQMIEGQYGYVYFCKNRTECSYYETYEIFVRGCLLTPEYYNDWVTCKIRKAHLKSNTNTYKEGEAKHQLSHIIA